MSKVIGRHSDIKFHLKKFFFTLMTPSCLFVCLTKMQLWPLRNLNSCLQDVQKWIWSSMLKFNPEKMEFIIFGSHGKLKKLYSHLHVRRFGKLMHPSVVVKNLCVWVDANFSIADHVHNICKTCFIKMYDLRQVRQYPKQRVAVVQMTTHQDICCQESILSDKSAERSL